MKICTGIDRTSTADLPATVKFAPGKFAPGIKRSWSKRLALSPTAFATFGVVSFLTCGGAVVAIATLAALWIH